jgi:acyl-CoA dehydrogenase
MSWDFTGEPEFQELLDWADRFATDKVYKLDLLWPHDTYRPLTDEQRKPRISPRSLDALL